MKVHTKRIAVPPAPRDGVRVLVDRTWPRGFDKQKARINRWLPDLAPSGELRKFFGHDPDRWREFRRRYRRELSRPKVNGIIEELVSIAARGTLTLVYGDHDERHNQAVVLKEIIDEML